MLSEQAVLSLNLCECTLFNPIKIVYVQGLVPHTCEGECWDIKAIVDPSIIILNFWDEYVI